MALARHVGRVTEIQALGQTWKMGRLTRKVWNDFLEWAKPRIPDPFDVVAKNLAKFPPQLQEVMVREAIALGTGHLALDSAPVQGLLGTLEGSCHLVWLLLREGGHDDLEEDAVMEILGDIGAREAKEAIERAAGQSPPAGN